MKLVCILFITPNFVSILAVDSIPPTISVVDDITRIIEFGLGGTIVTFTEPTATDNSGSVSLVSRTNAPGDFYPTGTTTVTYVFRDPSGNTASRSFNINVIESKFTQVVKNCWVSLC